MCIPNIYISCIQKWYIKFGAFWCIPSPWWIWQKIHSNDKNSTHFILFQTISTFFIIFQQYSSKGSAATSVALVSISTLGEHQSSIYINISTDFNVFQQLSIFFKMSIVEYNTSRLVQTSYWYFNHLKGSHSLKCLKTV